MSDVTMTETARRDDLAAMKGAELKELAEQVGVSKSGKLDELRERILAAEVEMGSVEADTPTDAEPTPDAEPDTVFVKASDDAPPFYAPPVDGLHIAAVLLLAAELGTTSPTTWDAAQDGLEDHAEQNPADGDFAERFQPRFVELYDLLAASPDELDGEGVHAEIGKLARSEWAARVATQAEVVTVATTPAAVTAEGEVKERKAPSSSIPVPEVALAAGVKRIPPMLGTSSPYQVVACAAVTAELGEAEVLTGSKKAIERYVELFCTWKTNNPVWEAHVRTPGGKEGLERWNEICAARRYYASGKAEAPKVVRQESEIAHIEEGEAMVAAEKAEKATPLLAADAG